ncbi:MAG: TRAP transporter small permease subunit [Rhodothermia bacterium]|nr:TRAP transporter small permease subunit [Rhodothermia bacterium]
MQFWLRVASSIDRFSERTGRIVYWLTLFAVIIGSYNAVVRYLDRYTGLGLSSNFYIELQWYFFGVVFLLGAAYTLKHDAHVRVDVFYGRLSKKGQAWVTLLGTILFLFPFCILMLIVSWPAVRNSWAVMEVSPDPGGLPRYPIKTVIPVAFVLLIVQGISMLIRQIAIIRDEGGNDEAADRLSEAGHL